VPENNGNSQPHALDVVLSNFHIYVDRPEVPSFWMRVNDTLKERLSPLRFAQFVFQLGELGDSLEVWACAVRPFSIYAYANSARYDDLRLRFSRLCMLLGRSFRACSTSPCFR
jgi:hypothetical protein